MDDVSRREFLQSATAVAATGMLAGGVAAAPQTSGDRSARGAVAIASANGLAAVGKAGEILRGGGDPLDAAIAGVNLVEEDPDDHSVGYGGLPNEDGVVELDSCVMHGPSCGAGSVAALQRIKTPSKVARLVMQRTDHVMIVGEGALRFARAHGMEETDLLTDPARRIWLKWKENHSDKDDWIGAMGRPSAAGALAGDVFRGPDGVLYTYGTINCCTRTANGDLGGVTTTSGLSYKIPGRVGDSPIIGAGLYVDNEVGAAGSTGRGEAVIKICGAHTIIEAMRHGMDPTEACLQALKRIVKTTTEKRLLDEDGRPKFDVKFYALAKDGRFGAAAIWSGAKFALDDGAGNRLEEAKYLYERMTNDE